MKLDKAELDLLLNGKEPTMQEVAQVTAGVRLMSVRHHEPITNAMLVAACMEELASQRQEIDELKTQMQHVLAQIGNKRLKLGK